MSKLRARAIIPHNGGLILIHRIREMEGNIVEYYVFPGGGVEKNETPEQGVIREALEELSINIKVDKELYRVNSGDEVEIFFLCQYISGEIGIGNGPEFQEKGRGQYIPTIVPIDDLYEINVIEEIKQSLKMDLEKYGDFVSIPTRKSVLK